MLNIVIMHLLLYIEFPTEKLDKVAKKTVWRRGTENEERKGMRIINLHLLLELLIPNSLVNVPPTKPSSRSSSLCKSFRLPQSFLGKEAIYVCDKKGSNCVDLR